MTDDSVTRRSFLFGSAGAVAAGASGVAGAQSDGTTTTSGGEEGTTTSGEDGTTTSGGEDGTTSGEGEDGTTTGEGEDGGDSGGGGGGTKEVKVVDNKFDPEEVVIAPGWTVKWVFEDGGHNVKSEDGDWGTEGGEMDTVDSGTEFEHTFEETGEFGYYCGPHKSTGMVGTVVVQEGGPEEDSGSSKPAIPGSAKALGVATSGAMVFTLGLAYFFMQFGGDYGEQDKYE